MVKYSVKKRKGGKSQSFKNRNKQVGGIPGFKNMGIRDAITKGTDRRDDANKETKARKTQETAIEKLIKYEGMIKEEKELMAKKLKLDNEYKENLGNKEKTTDINNQWETVNNALRTIYRTQTVKNQGEFSKRMEDKKTAALTDIDADKHDEFKQIARAHVNAPTATATTPPVTPPPTLTPTPATSTSTAHNKYTAAFNNLHSHFINVPIALFESHLMTYIKEYSDAAAASATATANTPPLTHATTGAKPATANTPHPPPPPPPPPPLTLTPANTPPPPPPFSQNSSRLHNIFGSDGDDSLGSDMYDSTSGSDGDDSISGRDDDEFRSYPGNSTDNSRSIFSFEPKSKRQSKQTVLFGRDPDSGGQEYGPVQHWNKHGHNIDYYIKTRWNSKDKYINNTGNYIELDERVINSLQPILPEDLQTVKIIGQGDNVYNVVNKKPFAGEGRFKYIIDSEVDGKKEFNDYEVEPAEPVVAGGSKKGRNKTLKKRNKK